MAVPFIDLRRFEPGFLDRWLETCRRLTAETQFVGGPEVQRLEQDLAAESGVAEVVACANGTDALQLALRAAGVGPGDLVLIPDATFWATFEAVVNCGARVITIDVDPADLQMDFELFRLALDEYRPKAAILVHLYGWGSARLAEFRALCAEREVVLVEDGAQVYGVRWQGESIFRGAQLATVSFYPAKVLGSCGDAGAVYCGDPRLAARVRQLGNHGRSGHYSYAAVGWNSRMSGFDAAFLNLSREYLPERLASRRRAAAWYRQRLGELGLRVMAPPPEFEENGYLNVTLFAPEERPAVEAALRAADIGHGVVYPGSISVQPGAAGDLEAALGGEHADRLCRGVLNLPLFAHVTDAELEEVAAAFERRP